MTALAGFWSAGPSLAPDSTWQMLAAQALYAPEPPVLWHDGPVTLGRGLHPLVPEDRYDRGIVRDRAGRALAADVRLDNRDELATALRLERAGTVSDAAILAAALGEWGTAALDRVAGDFAFAWWDAPAGRLVLARDFFGQRPLHLHRGDGFVAFASMPKGLHALSAIPRRADRQAAAALLALHPDTGTRSYFETIEKVPAGHLVTIDADGVRTQLYWRPEPRTLRLPDADAYAEALREQMDRAVAARLRGSEGRLGAMLSAGLDSGTVAATAARLLAPDGRLFAFTAVPRAGFVAGDDRLADEGPIAAAVAACHPNIDHVLVRGERSPLAALSRDAFLFDRPMLNPCNGVWADALCDAARQRGVRVLLSGAMGNASFSHDGMDRLGQLLARGRFVTLAREARALRRRGMRRGTIANAAVGPWLGRRTRALALRLAGRAGKLSDVSLIAPDVVPRRAGDDPLWPAGAPGARQRGLLARVDYGNYTKGMLGGWGIDVRDPTADRRLVEFCLSVPPEHYLSGGVTRALARRAFADRLPAAAVTLTRKGYQGADWYEGLDASRAELGHELAHIGRDPLAADLIDLSRAETLLADWPSGARWQEDRTEGLYRHALLRGVSVGHFLRHVSGVN